MPSQHPGTLDSLRGADDEDRVAARLATRLQQQRHVEHGKAHPPLPAPVQEAGLFLADERMDDRLQPRHRLRLAQHGSREADPVDRAIADGVGESRRDQGNGPAAIERMDRGIGIMDRNAARLKQSGGGRLAHADRAGQAEDEGHGVPRPGARGGLALRISGRGYRLRAAPAAPA